MTDLIVGTIRGAHGMRGEVRLYPESDVADRFRPGAVLECDGLGPLTVASLRGTPEEPIVRFEGYTSRPAAQALQQRVLRVSMAEARRATDGAYLWADLLGLAVVTPAGASLGTVHEVLRAGGADVLVVRGARELLLPMIASVIGSIDLERRTIVASPPEEA